MMHCFGTKSVLFCCRKTMFRCYTFFSSISEGWSPNSNVNARFCVVTSVGILESSVSWISLVFFIFSLIDMNFRYYYFIFIFFNNCNYYCYIIINIIIIHIIIKFIFIIVRIQYIFIWLFNCNCSFCVLVLSQHSFYCVDLIFRCNDLHLVLKLYTILSL